MMYYFVIQDVENPIHEKREFGVVADTRKEAEAIFVELADLYRIHQNDEEGPDLKSVQFGLQQRIQTGATAKCVN